MVRAGHGHGAGQGCGSSVAPEEHQHVHTSLHMHAPHGAEFAATTRRPVATSMPQNSCPNGDGGSPRSSG